MKYLKNVNIQAALIFALGVLIMLISGANGHATHDNIFAKAGGVICIIGIFWVFAGSIFSRWDD